MAVELPKDAEGREIPPDTECLCTCNGEKQDVPSFMCCRREDRWEIGTDTYIVNSIYLYLTPPDSWEKLLEDLDRAPSTPSPDTYASIACGYFDGADVNCSVCEYMHGMKNETCSDDAWRDIASRIRKLRGDGE